MANNNIPVTKTVVVEDSVTHQAGDGMTANFSPSLETPDIFDNTAQAVVKQQTVIVDENAEDATVVGEKVQRINPQTDEMSQANIQQQGRVVSELDTLSDGSVDVPRDGQ